MKILLTVLSILITHFAIAQTGCIRGNCSTGNGTYKFDNGDTYTGAWMDGARTGYGRYDWADGSYYVGNFVNNILEGEGEYHGSDGNTMKGTFKNGNFVGSTPANSACTVGDCKNGNGTYKFDNGDTYTGNWVNGKRTGYGRYDWVDGSYYVGNFKDDLLEGEGDYTAKDGTKMTGLFRENNFQGATNNNSISDTNSDTNYLDSLNMLFEKADAEKKAAMEKAIKKDFCTVMQTVVNDFANNFENIKGDKENAALSFGDAWYSNILIENSIEAKVNGGFLTDVNSWYDILYKSQNFDDAKNKYDGYVNSLNTCKIACCTFAYDTSNYKSDSYETYTTSWLTFLVRDGYNDTYQDIILEMELSKDVGGNGWEVYVRVKDVTE